MNLSKIFITRPVMTELVMLFLLISGAMAYRYLPVNDLPKIDFPVLTVTTTNPGASPTTMANTVATPLEREFMTIGGIQSITSNSTTGNSIIVLQFALDKSLDSASLDVESAINRALPNLPSNLPYNPTYKKINPADTPILYYAVTSPSLSLNQLYDYANNLVAQRLSMVDGVAAVTTYGSPYAARIEVDTAKMAGMGLGIDEVAHAIQSGSVLNPLGNLYGDKNEFSLQADGQLLNAEGFNQLSVRSKEGTLVKIEQIGKAKDSLQNDKYYLRYLEKGQEPRETVVITIQKQAGSNAVKIIETVNELLPTLQKQLPASIELHKIYDKSETINGSIFDVELTLIIALALVVLVIFLLLGKVADTIIPSLVIPLSIFATFGVMLILGFSLDVLSLLAITLSIGFLVDDAIVVLENSVRHIEMGKHPKEAALDAAKEISVTLLSMTLCLATVFLPMLLLGGIVGRLFREFSLTIIIAISFSGFISLSLTPLLCARYLPARSGGHRKSRLQRFSDALNHQMLTLYESLLNRVMRQGWTMLLIAALCIGGSVYLANILPKDFLPLTDMGILQGYSESATGTSPFQMGSYQADISDVFMKDPSIDKAISACSIPSFGTDNQGIMFVRLVDHRQRPSITEVSDRLLNSLAKIPGVNSYLSPLALINLQLGTKSKALYQYALTSLDQGLLEQGLTALLDEVKKDSAFTQVSSDLQINQPQVSLHILRDQASTLQVSVDKIEQLLGLAYSGGKLSSINTERNQYYVILTTLPELYKDPTVLNQLYIRSETNALVPLSQVVAMEETLTPLSVNHFNGIPAATISFNLAPDASLSDAVTLLNAMAEKSLPPTVIGGFQGTVDIFAKSFANLSLLFIVMICVIYLILGILYENFTHPITVMSTLPPAAFGGLLTLFFFGQTLSLMAFLGLIMLIGIVMKNGVILIDFANELVTREKRPAKEAMITACKLRFRPIMMTTIAAFFGALPIALALGGPSSEGNRSLGLVVAGGLAFSQLLTLLLTPVTFCYLEEVREWVLAWKTNK